MKQSKFFSDTNLKQVNFSAKCVHYTTFNFSGSFMMQQSPGTPEQVILQVSKKLPRF